MVVSDIRDPYNAELVHGAISKARASGLIVTITGTEHVVADEVRVIRMLRSQRPRALALTGTRSGSMSSRAALLRELERYERDGGRIVVAGEDDLPYDTAVIPRQEGARLLVATLAELGYRSVALIRPYEDSAGVRAWEAGITKGARESGVRVDRTISVREPSVSPPDACFAATVEFLADGHHDVDALVATSDTLALGVMGAMRQAGLVPGLDVGVAGFEDVVDADDVTPGLTSVDLSLEAVGGAVVELALRAPDERRRLLEFEARVAVRGSTPPRA